MNEFSRRVECPHCGSKTWVHMEFDFNEANDQGCKSEVRTDQCNECGESFKVKAYLNFDIDAETEAIKKEGE